jgi:hypothetical protein
MQYLFLIYGCEADLNDPESKQRMTESMALIEQLKSGGKFVAAAPLEPATSAVTLRNRKGPTRVTDGPFAETKEQLGGFFLLELADLNEAVSVASKFPAAGKGAVEIRGVATVDGLPPAIPIPEGVDTPLKPYMLISYDDEAAWKAAGPAAMEQAVAKVIDLCQELRNQGRLVVVSPLQSAAKAANVRKRDGRVTVIDGPFAETNEVVGGFYVVLAESREAALEIARRHPAGVRSDVEVRPLLDLAPMKKKLGITV